MAKSTNSKGEYTISYQSMRGVDFSAGPTSERSRYAYLENMYRDYKSGEADLIESAPGFRKIFGFGEKINSIFKQTTLSGEVYAVVHAGESLYRFKISERDSEKPPSPLKIKIKDGKSAAFESLGELYILDGDGIIKISEAGDAARVGMGLGIEPYIPLTYINGEEYEQRNILQKKFEEKYIIFETDAHAYGSDSLKYSILSEENLTCTVTGADSRLGAALSIPKTKNILGKTYRVVSISDSAFSEREEIESVVIAEGITDIGNEAFAGAINLREVVIADTVTNIGELAFSGAGELNYLYLGIGVKRVGRNMLLDAGNLLRINYGGSANSFSGIENSLELLYDRELIPSSARPRPKLEIPVFTPTGKILSVKVNGVPSDFEENTRDGKVISLLIPGDAASSDMGDEVILLGEAYYEKNTASERESFLGLCGDISPEAILGATVCESFDGRVFLSGNPKYPNAVFHSAFRRDGRADPTYFGEFNYFTDGSSASPIASILAAGDSLIVFGSEGGIYYHSAENSGHNLVPRVYPRSSLHTGIGVRGDSISFFDDPVFLSELGLTALEKLSANLERSIVSRSHNINLKLLSLDLRNARFAVWCGYLALLVGSELFLADSRSRFIHSSGNIEYEWFYFSKIGSYEEDERVYRYSKESPHGSLSVKEGYENCAIYLPPESFSDAGRLYYYVEEDGIRYSIYPTDEFTGGVFYPATALASFESEILLFGTENGDLCAFNNDMRGIPPKHIKESDDYDPITYYLEYGGKIHPYFYTAMGHAQNYELRTVRENCTAPHLLKSTVKSSLAVKLYLFGEGELLLDATTDTNGYREITRLSEINLSEGDKTEDGFSNVRKRYKTMPFKEKEKGWVEKDIGIKRCAAFAPIGVYSVSYRYKIKGKIK